MEERTTESTGSNSALPPNRAPTGDPTESLNIKVPGFVWKTALKWGGIILSAVLGMWGINVGGQLTVDEIKKPAMEEKVILVDPRNPGSKKEVTKEEALYEIMTTIGHDVAETKTTAQGVKEDLKEVKADVEVIKTAASKNAEDIKRLRKDFNFPVPPEPKPEIKPETTPNTTPEPEN